MMSLNSLQETKRLPQLLPRVDLPLCPRRSHTSSLRHAHRRFAVSGFRSITPLIQLLSSCTHPSDLSITAPGAHKPRPFLTMSRAHQKTAIAAYRSLIAEHVTVEALRRTYGDSAPSVDTVRGEFKGESQLDADRLPLIANLHKANVFCLHGSYNPEEKGSQPVTCHSFEPGWCSIAVYLTATAGDDSDSLSADSPVLEVLERASTGSRLWEPGNAVPQVICFVYPT